MASLIRIADATYNLLARQSMTNIQVNNVGNFALGEAFPVFSMSPDDWPMGSFFATSLWHFQIKRYQETDPWPAGYLRARIFGPRDEDWEFCGLFDSPMLANGIDNALTIADEHDDDDDKEAKLLVAPSYHLTALWLSSKNADQDRFIIAYAPGWSGELTGENAFLDRGQFRERASGLSIIQGRINDREQGDVQ